MRVSSEVLLGGSLHLGTKDPVHPVEIAVSEGEIGDGLVRDRDSIEGLFVLPPRPLADKAFVRDRDFLATGLDLRVPVHVGNPALVPFVGFGISDNGPICRAVGAGCPVAISVCGERSFILPEALEAVEFFRHEPDPGTKSACVRGAESIFINMLVTQPEVASECEELIGCLLLDGTLPHRFLRPTERESTLG